MKKKKKKKRGVTSEKIFYVSGLFILIKLIYLPLIPRLLAEIAVSAFEFTAIESRLERVK